MAIIENIMEEFIRNELVNEATVARDKKSSAVIGVSLDESRGYGGNVAYFKFKPNANVDWAHSARISFREPEYIDHYGKSYRLHRPEKETLIRLLNSPSCVDKNITGWIAAIRNFNDIVKGMSGDKYILPEDLPMPDYMKL